MEMKTSNRKLDERVGRLLRAGRPAYAENLDLRLRERLARIKAEKRPIPLRPGIFGWTLAASMAAAALLIAAGLIWWPATGPKAPAGAPTRETPSMAEVPRPVPVSPATQAARVAHQPVPGTDRRPARRIDGWRHAATKEPVRLEFAIPEQEITILWVQRSNFSLAALVGGTPIK
jgi:hypothetical protein